MLPMLEKNLPTILPTLNYQVQWIEVGNTKNYIYTYIYNTYIYDLKFQAKHL